MIVGRGEIRVHRMAARTPQRPHCVDAPAPSEGPAMMRFCARLRVCTLSGCCALLSAPHQRLAKAGDGTSIGDRLDSAGVPPGFELSQRLTSLALTRW